MSAELTVRERSCLLRAAREKLHRLDEDYDSTAARPGGDHARKVLAEEIDCLTGAISWLWRQPAVD